MEELKQLMEQINQLKLRIPDSWKDYWEDDGWHLIYIGTTSIGLRRYHIVHKRGNIAMIDYFGFHLAVVEKMLEAGAEVIYPWDVFDYEPELIDDPTFLKHFRATCTRYNYYLKKQGDSYEIFSGQTEGVVEIEQDWLKQALVEKMLVMGIEVKD